MDGAMGKAPLGGRKTGPNPTDRAKKGTKRSPLTDGRGAPLGLVAAGANVNDHELMHPTLQSIPVERPTPTRRRRQGLCLDKGYDYEEVRALAREFGFTQPSRRRGEERKVLVRSAHKKARRWVVERTHSWIQQVRSVRIPTWPCSTWLWASSPGSTTWCPNSTQAKGMHSRREAQAPRMHAGRGTGVRRFPEWIDFEGVEARLRSWHVEPRMVPILQKLFARWRIKGIEVVYIQPVSWPVTHKRDLLRNGWLQFRRLDRSSGGRPGRDGYIQLWFTRGGGSEQCPSLLSLGGIGDGAPAHRPRAHRSDACHGAGLGAGLGCCHLR